jgi:hypothetical protein
MNATNIVMDVHQALNRQSGDELVRKLGCTRGASRAWVSPCAPRLVLVDYDPQQTDTQKILGTIVRQGFNARLVGM